MTAMRKRDWLRRPGNSASERRSGHCAVSMELAAGNSNSARESGRLSRDQYGHVPGLRVSTIVLCPSIPVRRKSSRPFEISMLAEKVQWSWSSLETAGRTLIDCRRTCLRGPPGLRSCFSLSTPEGLRAPKLQMSQKLRVSQTCQKSESYRDPRG